MTALTQGQVEIKLGDEKLVLKPTFRAGTTVSAFAGGYGGAFDGLRALNHATYAAVIAAGLGKRTNSEIEEISERVWTNGLGSLTEPLAKYILLLMNGGKEPVEKEPKGGN